MHSRQFVLIIAEWELTPLEASILEAIRKGKQKPTGHLPAAAIGWARMTR